MRDMKQLFAIYRATARKGQVSYQNVPSSLFSADKALISEFFAQGRKLYTIEAITKLYEHRQAN